MQASLPLLPETKVLPAFSPSQHQIILDLDSLQLQNTQSFSPNTCQKQLLLSILYIFKAFKNEN